MDKGYDIYRRNLGRAVMLTVCCAVFLITFLISKIPFLETDLYPVFKVITVVMNFGIFLIPVLFIMWAVSWIEYLISKYDTDQEINIIAATVFTVTVVLFVLVSKATDRERFDQNYTPPTTPYSIAERL